MKNVQGLEGLVGDPIAVAGRKLVLTVDFEAFTSASLLVWGAAMDAWAEATARHQLRFDFFIAVEDVAALRVADPSGYQRFLEHLRHLANAGVDVHAHNHGPYDPETGAPATPKGDRRHVVPGYPKRASFYYDTVYRQERDLGAWLDVVRAEHGRLLADARIPSPSRPAFRAGGWDHGAAIQETRAYTEAVASARFAYDSSASYGTYGTKTWRVGKPYGDNVFRLRPDLIEVAASWSVNCGVHPLSPRGATSLARLLRQRGIAMERKNGAAVAVLHFDHLFADGRADRAPRRAVIAVSYLARIRSLLEIESVRLADVMP